MKKAIVKSYGKKGEDVVNMNFAAVDRGGEYKVLPVDPAWANLPADEAPVYDEPEFVSKLVRPINAQNGADLPVSAYKGYEDGAWEQGTAAYEKRGVAGFVPVWNPDNCIQCNKCAFVCPHAAIRPIVMDAEEVKGFEGKTIEMKAPAAMKGMNFVIQVDVKDCLGCGNCADVCPGNPKLGGPALKMVAYDDSSDFAAQEAKNWEYCMKKVSSKQDLVDIKQSPKNSQFAQPLFEFSGACSGCGETPYVKLMSQLFGDRIMASNATGCSSIYSGSIPSTPYTKNAKGQGPAWSNSLFEDFCEYGLGMALANKKMKIRIEALLKEATAHEECPAEFKTLAEEWIANKEDADKTKEIAPKLREFIAEGAKAGCPTCAQLKELDHYLVKRSQWIIGGDGASYDIGYGGLDHVIGSGEDVNIFVIDTEVYSNTGGQASKATPIGAIAQFAANGKRVGKKDLGLMQATYGNVYVAQVAMGADQSQCLKAFREAEAWHGPSLVIAYAPCINHGLKAKGGMGKSQAEEAKAVECGYWHLWRNNPALAEEGKNPFQLDSKEPDWDKFQDFLEGEVRFLSLKKAAPAEAQELYDACKAAAQRRYKTYVRKTQEDWSV
jgi:pyruvate-ferredoxin/flavodoxin oxidoreductase